MKIVDGKAVAETPEEEAALRTLLDAETTGLKAKRDELFAKLKELDALKGIDPNEYKTLKEQAEKAEEARAIKAGEFDSIKQQMLAAHKKELDARDAKIETLNKSVTENVLKAQITDAIAKAEGSTLLLSPHVISRTKLDENYRPVVVDESGNVRVKADGSPMAITDLITEMKLDVSNYGMAFKASGTSGSGAQHSNGTGSSSFDKMSRTELAQAANNPATKAAADAFILQKFGG